MGAPCLAVSTGRPSRSWARRISDLVTFPVRAVTLFEEDACGLSSLRSERFDYVAREVRGYCLDVGCGRHDAFIQGYLGGRGVGIDVYPYEGLQSHQVVRDMTRLPFEDASFDSVTFIANLNHIPAHLRDLELAEAHRCLKEGGNVIVTMGHPLAEILVHRVVGLYDRCFGTRHDMDAERGMEEGESYFLTDSEIRERLTRAGFRRITRRRFATQWGLNHLLVGWKDLSPVPCSGKPPE